MQEWVDKLVTPMAKILYPLFVGKGLDSHHAFVVEYKVGKDEKLDFHVDDSEVTLNVCLGRIFTGGTLFFRGIRCAQHQQTDPQENELFDFGHLQGRGILHIGRHRHGANKIKSGERFNLVCFMYIYICGNVTINRFYGAEVHLLENQNILQVIFQCVV